MLESSNRQTQSGFVNDFFTFDNPVNSVINNKSWGMDAIDFFPNWEKSYLTASMLILAMVSSAQTLTSRKTS